MTNTIQVRRGANADLPVLDPGEFGFSTDSHRLYIGDGSANHEIGKVSALTEMVQYTNEGVGVSLGTLPANSIILDIIIATGTGFDDTGTDIINIGTPSLHTYLVNGFDVSSAGYGEPASNTNWKWFGSATEIFGYYEGANNDANNGIAIVIIEYVRT